MPLLINCEVVEDNWTLLSEEAFTEGQNIPAGDVIVPLAAYLTAKDTLSDRDGQLAIQINGDDDLSVIIDELFQFPLIAIDFPVLRDGRGFSIARLLLRNGYKGQIRATGDIGHDRLEFLQRCGFNAIQVADDVYSPEMLNAFTEMTTHYQSAADNVRPVYHQQ